METHINEGIGNICMLILHGSSNQLTRAVEKAVIVPNVVLFTHESEDRIRNVTYKFSARVYVFRKRTTPYNTIYPR